MGGYTPGAFSRASIWCAFAPLILSCAADSPGVVYEDSARVTPDGLYEVRSWDFDRVFVKPGARVGDYRGLLIDELAVEYKDPPEPPRGSERGAEPDPALGPLRRYFRECFGEELAKSAVFSRAERVAPDALRLRGRILDLEVDVPAFADEHPTASNFVKTAGRFTLVLDVRDSLSDAPVARFTRESEIRLGNLEQLYRSTPISDAVAVRRILKRDARRLREHLERLHELRQIPPLPPASRATGPA